MNALRVFIIATTIGSFGSLAVATEQTLDKLMYGGNEYAIFETPMLGLWHYGEGDPPAGKSKPPAFDVTTSTNAAGYSARWEIRGGKFFLHDLNGVIDGKRMKNEKILPQCAFPVQAHWFSGRIHMPIGDFSEKDGEYESVVVFEIDQGIVKSITFFPTLRLNFLWNGVGCKKVCDVEGR